MIPNNLLSLFLRKDSKTDLDVCIVQMPNVSSMEYASLESLSFDLSLIDRKLRDALLPFQLAGLEYIPKITATKIFKTIVAIVYAYRFALKKQGKILLADDMGLGKTVQSLAIVSFYRREWPLLILVPASLVACWEQVTSVLRNFLLYKLLVYSFLVSLHKGVLYKSYIFGKRRVFRWACKYT